MNITLIELIGYLLTMGLATSMALSKTIRLRWIMFGLSLIVAGFGLIMLLNYDNFSVFLINLCFAGINGYVIWKIHRIKDYFRLFEVKTDSRYLNAFIEYYFKEINHIVPYFSYSPNDKTKSFVLLKNMAVVGVFIVNVKDEQTLQIELDFVIPEFRDYKMGKFIYLRNQDFFYEKGYRQFHIVSLSKQNDEYLEKMGFHEDNSSGERIFVKEILPS
jgi:hypothetical protein